MGKQPLFRRIGRLFVIKTRWEAWAVTWAIALGAVERGKHYLALYPGLLGWVFFVLCCGVVFVAGAKLLDSVRQVPAPLAATEPRRPLRRVRLRHRYRPRSLRTSTVPGLPPARRSD